MFKIEEYWQCVHNSREHPKVHMGSKSIYVKSQVSGTKCLANILLVHESNCLSLSWQLLDMKQPPANLHKPITWKTLWDTLLGSLGSIRCCSTSSWIHKEEKKCVWVDCIGLTTYKCIRLYQLLRCSIPILVLGSPDSMENLGKWAFVHDMAGLVWGLHNRQAT